MSSIHDLGGPDRIEALGKFWAEQISQKLIARNFISGSPEFLDEGERAARALLVDFETDYPHAGILARLAIRDALKAMGGAL